MSGRGFLRRVLSLAGVIGITAFVTTTVVSEPDQESIELMQGEVDEMMQAWMRAAQPGPQHERLMKRAGAWRKQVTHWPYPGAEPTTSVGHSEAEEVFGGRYLIERTRGDMEFNGEKMEYRGMSVHGYDNIKHKYVFAWIDSMGTMIMTGEGEADPDDPSVITYRSEFPSPMDASETMRVRMIERTISDDRYELEWHEDLGGGAWHKSMELVAIRQ